jgi:hypothetical protein
MEANYLEDITYKVINLLQEIYAFRPLKIKLFESISCTLTDKYSNSKLIVIKIKLHTMDNQNLNIVK